jgi:hypothetical protein
MAADEAREAEAEAWSEALVGDVADEPRRHGGWATSLSIGDRPSRSVLQPGPGATRLIVGQPPGRTFPVSRNRAQVVAFTIAASLMIASAVAGTPIYLSADPPKAKTDSGPNLSLGRVGPDPCPGGLCRTERNRNLYNFITPKGPRPIEQVPGILLSIPLGNAAR